MSRKKHDFVSKLNEAQIDKLWTLDDFDVAYSLGKGRFGNVYLAKETRTAFNYIVALKVISKENLIENGCESTVEKELDIHKSCLHPNIMKNYGFFHTENHIFYILEYCSNGNLYSKIGNGPLDEREGATYIYQISRAIEYIHSRGIVHRDIKPENCVIGYWGELKLGDFGWATYLAEDSNLKIICGTLDYLCPEMLLGLPYNFKLDTWCIGVLCYELLVSKPPFLSESKKETQRLIKSVTFSIPNHLSKEVKQLIKKLLLEDPEQRLSASAILKDAWIKKNAEFGGNYLDFCDH